MQVHGPTHLHGPQAISGPHAARAGRPGAPGHVAQPRDELNLSDAGRAASDVAGLVDSAKNLPEIRQDRVDQIRARIATGTYETPERLDAALDRLLDEIG